MIQPTYRYIYIILVLGIFFFASSRDLAFSGSKAVSTSKAVFYVY
jgi:hypothetical protein